MVKQQNYENCNPEGHLILLKPLNHMIKLLMPIPVNSIHHQFLVQMIIPKASGTIVNSETNW
ncbi:hypothetical protein WICANDRAFT_90754 [Wickerhamomyces anomalus NRRL Y-366-8]|uniref:Uncharacterized protein n=1 Tax=Wickerhamomyces anomalus (strain ATCC 58044 / CBS 1984 / NCYC 433 / NRRL Y-366-8) TaxID=683960 RepID=A0A1E3P7R5_WICAA|nr:uncharacterized protein WICANDRAFT_90754 [Wickerhamomyces anomalus NRRL Y-366-8]ODQ61350.1 hypothetical protein WICANDRAFT_90754 [Wickerhamomyces anomalus NRRL Y-366-8]